MNLMMALYKHCGGWWTQIIQTAWWEIFTDCPGDIAGKNLIRHSLRLGTAPTQCVERLVQYKEGSRRRRYRWCSTRRGAVHSSCYCKPIGKSIGQNPVSIRRHHDHHLRMRSDYWDQCDETVLLCYCVTGISVFLGSHKSINIKLWWETYWSKLWIGLSRHSNKYNSESAIF